MLRGQADTNCGTMWSISRGLSSVLLEYPSPFSCYFPFPSVISDFRKKNHTATRGVMESFLSVRTFETHGLPLLFGSKPILHGQCEVISYLNFIVGVM